MTDGPAPEQRPELSFTGAPAGRRDAWCGDVRPADIGRTVHLCGWVARRREHGEHLAFVDLRDRTGLVQCVVDGSHDVRAEYVVRVTGTVQARPDGTVNPNLATGEVELHDCEVEILSVAEPPPFPLDDRREIDETLRLRHRYLDLRRGRMQHNLLARAKINSALRSAMERQGFVEIETPMLIASTPEGARDFVVPSRQSPGDFYALPQSPQLFKQLAMVGGIDRYYQIARCLRDEDLRADRQFEFMQLDLEASFVGQEEVLAFTSEAVADATEAVTGERPASIPSMTWHEAMERYGSDKPDVRFGLELVELTEVFAATGFNAFRTPCVKGIRLPGGAELGRKRLDDLTDRAKQWGAKGLAWFRVEDGALSSPVAKFLSDDEQQALRSALDAEVGDLLLLVADERTVVRHVLGLLRLELGRPPVNAAGFHFLWVVDFPLFEGLGDDGRPLPAHHPFTMPHADDLSQLASSDPSDLLSIRSQAYDLVLNGWELGSGSVRIHRPDIQQRIFELLGIGEDEAQLKFGFLLDAFRYGPPPHAGFAFGIDRLTALLVGEENIREVIAYPKTQSGADPLTGAPGPIDAAQLTELGLRLLPKKA
ncbi:MAG TPA: aspartate--tRNA ligase [Acidimicrobiales bacterium]|jgi:aspartyl-tRNA synthetase|nr:aspartate--tRNA ligase [Acidimicrobiales bacterium]